MNQLVLNENEKATLTLVLDTFLTYSDTLETKAYILELLNTVLNNTLSRYQDLVCIRSMLAEYELLLSPQIKRQLNLVAINLELVQKIDERLPKIKAFSNHESI